ncbi:MAG TPA: carboxylating nicotinate-nucleotide diphosphorylase [Gemmatimonadales bacterium]|nr:carboxylating nicotinate-nucleotide diphosphorylase [Gemmatimonadales bacterium]
MIDPTFDARRLAELALAEDGERDITTEVTGAGDAPAHGVLEARTTLVLAGVAYADAVARAVGIPGARWRAADGDELPGGSILGELNGTFAQVLRAERPLLNLLQRACGIATATRAYVRAVEGTGCRILHTRKTAPGLRGLDLLAVLAGGGRLHRAGLAHEVMIKDNHWRALEQRGETLKRALTAAKDRGVEALYVEVETEEQVRTATHAGATRLLVDNQTPETVKSWKTLARIISPRIELEATGGITIENVRAYAEAGVDYVSIGALTHSVKAADVALEVRA